MRVLLDESLPRQLARELGELEVATVHEKGWSGKTNGELLRLASPEFDAFLTADQNLEHQQNIARYTLRIVVLAARDNRLRTLLPLLPRMLQALEALEPGELLTVRGP